MKPSVSSPAPNHLPPQPPSPMTKPRTTSSLCPSCDPSALQHDPYQQLARARPAIASKRAGGGETDRNPSVIHSKKMLHHGCGSEPFDSSIPAETQVSDTQQKPEEPAGCRGKRISCGPAPEGPARSEISKEQLAAGGSGEQPAAEDCGRERLKRHRKEMAGRVWIPEEWGQESLLKDWIDCSVFDRSLVPKGLVSARQALVEGCRRANTSPLRIGNQC